MGLAETPIALKIRFNYLLQYQTITYKKSAFIAAPALPYSSPGSFCPANKGVTGACYHVGMAQQIKNPPPYIIHFLEFALLIARALRKAVSQASAGMSLQLELSLGGVNWDTSNSLESRLSMPLIHVYGYSIDDLPLRLKEVEKSFPKLPPKYRAKIRRIRADLHAANVFQTRRVPTAVADLRALQSPITPEMEAQIEWVLKVPAERKASIDYRETLPRLRPTPRSLLTHIKKFDTWFENRTTSGEIRPEMADCFRPHLKKLINDVEEMERGQNTSN